ncbi:M14 family metallopeptidase [Clostridium grantii]|uniref:Gamma-D-glutamyl-(L)-meso-diaminopimelate peptidase I. Metallo peptidase. MEROPS family M14C n=1 Tax=Clostridium grantii DSM 8605 TaxID=1121316 RepID=A0A1M5TG71_9CLOT|nr:M14 family metallopeptidase [Clostridium grantii]SHH49757.1 gamma-D-glutamyl-{L}-meso-diaminopimelate peptidase I . Metallo peptidase. MEROPS family M14C [Clostridium grantii DSM 8605]
MKTLKLGSRGTDVKKLQAVLNKIGYDAGKVDGVFGEKTENAVMMLQRNFGLESDGIVGGKTWTILETYYRGYDNYRIRYGDTLYKISKAYYSNVDAIMGVNPGLNPFNLRVGMEIKVPYLIPIVDTNVDYTYDILEMDLEGLKAVYPFLEVTTEGKSVLGRNLYTIKLGKGPNKVFYNGAHHALEWITTPLLMKFIEEFAGAYAMEQNIAGYDPETIWNTNTIYIMPMVNPDGVDLVLNGLKKDNPYYNDLIKWNHGSIDFSRRWSANNRGVDLNHNYDASWQESKDSEIYYGVEGPGPRRYSGPSPVSEPEAKAVVAFTEKILPELVLAYHSQGRVIYWNYNNMATDRMKKIGEELAKTAGYFLAETYGSASYAGYKDWVIKKFMKPGYTVEVGLGINPLPISQFDRIYKENLGLLLKGIDINMKI